MSAPKRENPKAVLKLTSKDSEEEVIKSSVLKGSTEGTTSGPHSVDADDQNQSSNE